MTSVQDLLNRVKLAEPISSGSLFMWPLLAEGAVNGVAVVTLDEALAGKLAEVAEVSAGGSVPRLLVTNHSDRLLFLLDGEQILGAKQNRTFNMSMLVPPASRVTAPVSCLEQGRWGMAAGEVRGAEHLHFAQGRGRKMRSVSERLRHGDAFGSDQGEVWASVSERIQRADAASPTMAEAEYYAARRFQTNITLEQFNSAPGQVGAVYGIGARIAGIEIFDTPALFAKLAPKVARSYILDALETDVPAHPGARHAVEALLERIFNAPFDAFATPGAGESLRFGGGHLTGAALVYCDHCVHLAAFCDL